jgi:aspartyl-tRNA(Asn)/glutamyl-tRNA(Gln) amidotransferase subunit B
MANKYYFTVGLEIHAELATKTKMFCACKNDPNEEKPNTNICSVCMAHPGALPVINKKAVENVIKVGLALDGKIADFSEFDRKNYFYPDIPKGYQISQYKFPIVFGGRLAGMDITRIHLEEDTANNKHFDGDPAKEDGAGFSLIDFNRAGVPLMELVTEAHTFEDVELAAKTASNFAKEYQLVLQYIGASLANMEKGEMRVEANVSVSPDKDKKWTQYVEIKNLNSFKSVEKAIKYEAARMIELWEDGKQDEIVKETRGFDEGKQKTFSQRKKENSEDYRYFPDPDLPKLKLHEAFDLEKMKADLPELPEVKRARYKKDFGIKDEDTEAYVNDKELSIWFEKIAEILNDKEKVKTASNYITTDYMGLKKANLDVRCPSAEHFAELINLATDGKISSRAAKDILAIIVKEDASPLKIATEKNMLQSNDEGALKEIVQKTIDANPEVVAIYKAGKENAIMSLVGKIIKESNGSANPQLVTKLLKEMLTQ